VDRFGFHAGGFGHPFCGASGGRAQEAPHLFGNENLEHRVYEGCLADAGSAGEHQHFGCERLFEGLLLAWGEVFACLLLAPCDGLFDVNGGKIRASGGQRLDARGHALLGALEFGQEDLDFAADLFQDEFAVLDRALESGFYDRIRHEKHFCGLRPQDIERKGAVSLVGGLDEDVAQSRAGAQQRIEWDSELSGDLVGGFEAYSRDVLGEAVWILANLLDRMFAIGFVNANRAAGAHSIRVEKNHDVADDFLLGPGIFDSPAALRPDPLDHFESGGVVFDDVENSFAELLHELACIHGSDALDEAGAEVFLDAFAGVGGGGGEQLRAELHAEVPVALPFAFGGKPFARVGRWERSQDSHLLAMALHARLEDAEAGILVEESDALDEPGDRLVLSRAGVCRPGHDSSKFVLSLSHTQASTCGIVPDSA